jgi:hypothetical protein
MNTKKSIGKCVYCDSELYSIHLREGSSVNKIQDFGYCKKCKRFFKTKIVIEDCTQ